MAAEVQRQERVEERPVTREEMRTLVREPKMPVRSWTPPTAGILELVAGYLNILTGAFMVVGSSLVGLFGTIGLATGIGIGAFLIVLGIVSVIGGSLALRRRAWGMALAGSITALFPSPAILLGILSLIFVTLGKPEFK